MGWFDKAKEFAAGAKTQVARFNNATFKEATMAVCALMAAADGEVEPKEIESTAQLIAGNDMLSVFPPSELEATFKKFCGMATQPFQRIELVGYVRKLKGNVEQSHLAIGVALVIANADGQFEPAEQRVVGELCGVLDLPASEYLN